MEEQSGESGSEYTIETSESESESDAEVDGYVVQQYPAVQGKGKSPATR